MAWKTFAVGVVLASAMGCGGGVVADDASSGDAGLQLDSTPFVVDTGPRDAGPPDSGPPDTGPMDSGPIDGGVHDAGHDAARADSGPQPDAGSGSRTYVIGAIESDTTDFTQAYGFDLDGMMDGPATLPCTTAADYTSPVTGDPAVDNQLLNVLALVGTMVGADGVEGALRTQIESGTLLIVLEVSGIDGFVDDPVVTVHAALAQPTSGTPMSSAACATQTDQTSCADDAIDACGWSPSSSSCSGIAAGETFTTMTDLGTSMGSITGGRLDATITMLPLPLSATTSTGTSTITLVLHDVRIAARISATNLTYGELGATVAVAELVAAVDAVVGGIDRALLESVTEPDMDPVPGCHTHTDAASCTGDTVNMCTFSGGVCTGDADGTHCNSISAGLGFNALSATLLP